MLTGKTEQQFKAYCQDKYDIGFDESLPYTRQWDYLPEFCQLALMQEFFRKINVLFNRTYTVFGNHSVKVFSLDNEESYVFEDEIEIEALKAAITKANDINNQK